ncbi:unnamed protein product [Pleuronectes platessa]|uniref:Uncharacterized protein n=1 Tax=Pleuronectes platessa TaxID=8262 RepID=A0A9N7YF60_PLEPL|nr:unnamed protein product [Pleuronectes platessa]
MPADTEVLNPDLCLLPAHVSRLRKRPDRHMTTDPIWERPHRVPRPRNATSLSPSSGCDSSRSPLNSPHTCHFPAVSTFPFPLCYPGGGVSMMSWDGLCRALSRLLSSCAPGRASHARSSQNNPPACRRKQNKSSGIFRVINFHHVVRR